MLVSMVCALVGVAGLSRLIYGPGYAGLMIMGVGSGIVAALAGMIYLGTRPGTSLSKASTQARDRQIKSLKKRELGFGRPIPLAVHTEAARPREPADSTGTFSWQFAPHQAATRITDHRKRP